MTEEQAIALRRELSHVLVEQGLKASKEFNDGGFRAFATNGEVTFVVGWNSDPNHPTLLRIRDVLAEHHPVQAVTLDGWASLVVRPE